MFESSITILVLAVVLWIAWSIVKEDDNDNDEPDPYA